MPYRDTEKQKAAQHQHYVDNKSEYDARSKKRRAERRIWFSSLLEGKCCVKCGESNKFCLDFHHRNPEDKEETIAKLLTSLRSKERILNEMMKCDIMCSNCHRILHRQGVV